MDAPLTPTQPPVGLTPDILKTYTHTHPDGRQELTFMVDGVHCAACLHRLESAVIAVKGVTEARLNLASKRLTLVWQGTDTVALKATQAAAAAGYPLTPYHAQTFTNSYTAAEKFLLRCLSVAAFASMNVMLLSVALWSGAEDAPAEAQLFRWLSALITLPALAYAGQPYFRGAWKAITTRNMGMDVPISVALILTSSLSLFDTIIGKGETYFESAIMLLFFLLCGRYLEARTRGRSHGAAEHLLGLQHTFVAVKGKAGAITLTPSAQVKVGSIVLWRQGERLGIDGLLLGTQNASIDTSLLTGESLPRTITPGQAVQAGLINRGPSLEVKVTATGEGTVLAELARLTDRATLIKNRYTVLADRIARAYAPVVHLLAFGTFFICLALGIDTHESLLRAAAVLIVTCPCALALAIPTVQVAVAGRLLRQGVIVKNGAALEKMATLNTVVFDKTGTLTHATPQLVGGGTPEERTLAARLAIHSRHPLAVALAHAGEPPAPLKGVIEHAGKGLEATIKGQRVRLGSAMFVGGVKTPEPTLAHTYLRIGKATPVCFTFETPLRPDAAQTLRTLTAMGLRCQLLSGDTPEGVAHIAKGLPFAATEGGASPKRKQQVLEALHESGEQVMMVGDGLNDAPSLALAPVGVSFGQASDLAKISADIILQQEKLATIPALLVLARRASVAVKTNIGLSFAYNAVTIPLAMMGHITPLLAAVAMSSSSLFVTLNAARLGWNKKDI